MSKGSKHYQVKVNRGSSSPTSKASVTECGIRAIALAHVFEAGTDSVLLFERRFEGAEADTSTVRRWAYGMHS
jgi:hypothetical protein